VLSFVERRPPAFPPLGPQEGVNVTLLP